MLGFHPISAYPISSAPVASPGIVKTRSHSADVYKLPGSTSATPAFVQNTSGTANSSAGSTTITVTAGNFLLVTYNSNGSPSAPTDTQSNTWTLGVTSGQLRMYYTYASSSGSITITHASASAINWIVTEYSGVASTSVVDTAPTNSGSNTLPTISTTTTVANDMFVMIGGSTNSYSPSQDTTDSFVDYLFANGTTIVPLVQQDKLITSATSVSGNFVASSFFQWYTAGLALKPGSTSNNRPQARGHTTDVNKITNTSKTRLHTTDTNKRGKATRTHTTDVNKRLTTLKTHSTDVNKRKTTTRTHTTDVDLRKTNTRTHSTDTLKRSQNLRTHTTDTLKRKTLLLIHSTDVNKKKAGLLKTHSTDVNKRKSGLLKIHTTDTFKRLSALKTHTTDVNKKKTGAISHTTDAYIGNRLASSISDNFNDNTQDTTLWNTISGGTTAETGGTLVASNAAGFSSYGGYATNGQYNLTGNYAYSQLVNAGNQSLSTFQAIPIQLRIDANNSLAFIVNGGNLIAQTDVAGSYSALRADTSYSSSVHKFFRIREASGTTYWDYSTDGVSWTNYTSASNPLAVTSSSIEILAGAYGAEGSSTSAVFDNFNTVPTPSYTRTHTTDILKRSSSTKAHTTDTLKRKSSVATHSTDVNKRKTSLKTHSTDVNKKKAGLLKAHSTDVNKRKTLSKTHTTDLNKRKSGLLKTHTTDVNKRKTLSKTHTTDTFLRATHTLSHSTDTFLRLRLTKTHYTDINKRKNLTKIHTTDVNKRKSGLLKTHSTDVNKRKSGLTRTYTTDVSKFVRANKTHTTDVALRQINTRSHTTDFALRLRTNYSRTDDVSLPTDASDLATPFTGTDYGTVSADDGTYVAQAATGYALFEFKYEGVDATYGITAIWNGKTTIPSSTTTVYMQIWNYTTSAWETLTSDSVTAANTDFTLTGVQLDNLDDYYSGLVVTIRIYQ